MYKHASIATIFSARCYIYGIEINDVSARVNVLMPTAHITVLVVMRCGERISMSRESVREMDGKKKRGTRFQEVHCNYESNGSREREREPPYKYEFAWES